ncbi:MAG: polysaccharide pyruvyl transferase family protein [Bacillus cereus]|jgi:polysaccharide pyruvyl transferase WcaK-like protein|nr:polysaccharide pyruvyl transferase family protein [Bacillus cereus]
MFKIGLLDPSLWDNNGNYSPNTGDIIIYDAVIKVLDDVFKDYDLIRVSTHTNPDNKLLKKLSLSDIQIIGGTNLLSSNIEEYNQWKFERTFFSKVLYPVKNIITLGVGWWQYQQEPTDKTKKYYKSILNTHYAHSVRDSYTKDKLIAMGINNVINTSCPTMWELFGRDVNKKSGNSKNCVFTLTDYNTSVENDTNLIKLLIENFSEKLLFFAQGSKDIEYIKSLDIYKANKDKFQFINSLTEYNKLLENGNITYIGTRLHAGARALQKEVDALVLQVDNRAKEITLDTNFPSIERNNLKLLQKWLNGDQIFSKMTIDTDNIKKWKEQFSQYSL